MPVASPRPLRARSALEKTRRRDDILRAAERLWLSTPYADLSMNQVAREAKLAKGTLYLYFDTKEELFLALLHEYLQGWFQRFGELLGAQRPQTPREMTATLTDALRDQTHLRRLLLLLTPVLRTHLAPEVEANFRRETQQMLQQAMSAMPYTPEINREILVHCYALSVGWQQMAPALGQTPHPGCQFLECEAAFQFALEAVIERLAQQPA